MRIDRRKRVTWGSSLVVIAASFLPSAPTMNAAADERCTPIAHVLDASQIPGNESSNPSGHPDERYRDKAGLNCVPTYELDFAGAIDNPAFPKGTCEPESIYDVAARDVWADPDYRAACRRLKFTMGPLLARPGMNDTLIHLTTFDKPAYDGFTLRWKPGLQAADGSVPFVENLHLHHGTWIGGLNGPTAATGPFFATGEEQTILSFPKGYGWRFNGNSAWSMLYMLHNALPQPQAVYITYDIDYIALEDAQTLGIRDTKSLWLDVGGSGGDAVTATGATVNTPEYSALNPIFNAQRGFGHADDGAFWKLTGDGPTGLTTKIPRNNAGTGAQVCYWPRENCSRFNSSQGVTNQQGVPVTNVIGNSRTLPVGAFSGANCATGTGGTLINMGGHVHPGGLRDEVSLKRGNQIVPIHISDAVYWDYQDPTRAGGPPLSWDLSMTGTIATPAGNLRPKEAWKIAVKPGDELILNGVYDTQLASTYDQMGIVMGWVEPGCDPEAIDPFDPNVIIDAGWATGPNFPPIPEGVDPAIAKTCTPGTVPSGEDAGMTVLCLRGNVTHGSMPSRQNHDDCTTRACPPLDPVASQLLQTHRCQPGINGTDQGECVTLTMQGFSYGPLDLGVASTVMPQVRLGTTMTFLNPDTAGMIWHTITRCNEPCNGPTSANYPVADGGTLTENTADIGKPPNEWTSMDFDSAILCAGLGCATTPVTRWSIKPSRTGTFTFWCRIHPVMRGAFEVVA